MHLISALCNFAFVKFAPLTFTPSRFAFDKSTRSNKVEIARQFRKVALIDCASLKSATIKFVNARLHQFKIDRV